MRTLLRALPVLLWLAAGLAMAIDPLPFRDAQEEARFRALAAELRCVMCQNQSLADSNAAIAQDLRREVFELMRQGRSDDEIKAFLTERYGEFVLYRPPMSARNWLLWFGPGLVLVIGAAALFVIVRRRSGPARALPPANDEEW
ncbi:MAG TPA: cytochrome c-type biogenesis protein [Xanthomonadaceae bacterium]|nr:cytochrome c-type biogenesis protein [Xanthomonadaceae bacterium]